MENLHELVQAIVSDAHVPRQHEVIYPSLLIGLLDDSPGLSRRQTDEIVERLLDSMLAPVTGSSLSWQAQNELVAFLPHARGYAREALARMLRRWFSEQPEKILWDRISFRRFSTFILTYWRSVIRRQMPVSAMTHHLGPFVVSLSDEWVEAYGIDLEPTLARWHEESNWLYHFAEWVIRSDAAARERPFAEIIRELGLKEE